MDKIPFEDGTLVKAGYVEIDGTKYETVQPEYTGEIPLSSYNLNKMQDNVENSINEEKLVKRINISGSSKQEVTTQSANLFNKNATSSAIAGTSGYVATNYIAAKTGDRIAKSNSTTVFFYDSSKIELGNTASWKDGTITIENVAYVRCNVLETDVDTFMFVRNQDLPSEYVAFVPDSPSIEYKAPIESVGDNINVFDSTLETQTINGVTISYDENDGTLTLNGTATATSGGGYLFKRYPAGTTMAELEANKTYSASLNVISGSFIANTAQEENSSIQFWQAWTYSFQLMFATISNNQIKITRTPTSNINLANIQLKVVEGDVFNNFKIAIKFEEGKVTPYSPYGQGSIGITMGDGTTSETKALYTQQPFRAIGDVKDKFVKQNGVWYEEHNISELILNGSESGWTTGTYGTNPYKVPVDCFFNSTKINLITSHFKGISYSDRITTDTNVVYCEITNNGNYAYFRNTIFTTLDEFKTWLSENNVQVIYQLATPTLIECTTEQVEVLNDIYSAYGEGMTNIICNDEVPAVIEIIKESKETVQSENDKAISALLERVSELEQLVASIQSTAVEEEA